MSNPHDTKMCYDTLHRLLTYDKATGLLYWNINTKNTRKGGVAGTTTDTGYTRVTINNVKYKAHRLIWVMYYNDTPNGLIDHKNNNRQDNRIENLRVASQSVNNRNRITNTRTTGILKMPSGRYRARIKVNNIDVHIGTYDTQDIAILARNNYIKDKGLYDE